MNMGNENILKRSLGKPKDVQPNDKGENQSPNIIKEPEVDPSATEKPKSPISISAQLTQPLVFVEEGSTHHDITMSDIPNNSTIEENSKFDDAQNSSVQNSEEVSVYGPVNIASPREVLASLRESNSDVNFSEAKADLDELNALDLLNISDIEKISDDSTDNSSSREIFGSLKGSGSNVSFSEAEVPVDSSSESDVISDTLKEKTIEQGSTLSNIEVLGIFFDTPELSSIEKCQEEQQEKTEIKNDNDLDNIESSDTIDLRNIPEKNSFFLSKAIKLLSLGAVGITFFAFAGVTLNSLISFLLTVTVLIVAKEGMSYLRSENSEVSNLTSIGSNSKPEPEKQGLDFWKTLILNFGREKEESMGRESASNSFDSKSCDSALKHK